VAEQWDAFERRWLIFVTGAGLFQEVDRVVRTALSASLGLALLTAGVVKPAGADHEPKLDRAGKRRTTAPEYAGKGRLKLPGGFRTWVFVGSNIGLQYREGEAETTRREQGRHPGTKIGNFHNVYINPEAYNRYLQTGKFPNNTVLVMDVYEAKEKDARNIVRGGYFPGDQRAVEVAVKNSKRPDGLKTDWAYYAFPDPSRPAPATAFKDADCYRCHKQHADDDNVWVQFYPTLRGQKQSGNR